MKDNLNTNVPDEAQNPAFLVGDVSGSFILGETVYYHRQEIVRRKCFVVGIEDNEFGLWIRFAENIDNMVVDKFVSCYDVSKNCH